MSRKFIVEIMMYSRAEVLATLEESLLTDIRQTHFPREWTKEQTRSFKRLLAAMRPLSIEEDLVISREPDFYKGILTTILSTRGLNPKLWARTDYWLWLDVDEDSFVRINAADSKTHFSFMVTHEKSGFYIHRCQAENPRSKLALVSAVTAIEDLEQLSTHISPSMYAKISSKGLRALDVALKHKNRSLDSALTKLQQALRKAVECESRDTR